MARGKVVKECFFILVTFIWPPIAALTTEVDQTGLLVRIGLFSDNLSHHTGAQPLLRLLYQGPCVKFDTISRAPRKRLFGPPVAPFADSACGHGLEMPIAFGGSVKRKILLFHYRGAGISSHGSFTK